MGIKTTLSAVCSALALLGCNATTGSNEPIAQQPVRTVESLRDLTPQEKAAIGRDVAKGLKDPDSARFEWTRVPRDFGNNGGLSPYCALVNARNGFGGYTGMKPYYAQLQTKGSQIVGAVPIGFAGDAASTYATLEQCKKFGLDPNGP